MFIYGYFRSCFSQLAGISLIFTLTCSPVVFLIYVDSVKRAYCLYKLPSVAIRKLLLVHRFIYCQVYSHREENVFKVTPTGIITQIIDATCDRASDQHLATPVGAWRLMELRLLNYAGIPVVVLSGPDTTGNVYAIQITSVNNKTGAEVSSRLYIYRLTLIQNT